MQNEVFITAAEVASVLNVSRATAYRLIAGLNEELKAKSFIVIPGKVSRKYFEERVYGIHEANE